MLPTKLMKDLKTSRVGHSPSAPLDEPLIWLYAAGEKVFLLRCDDYGEAKIRYTLLCLHEACVGDTK